MRFIMDFTKNPNKPTPQKTKTKKIHFINTEFLTKLVLIFIKLGLKSIEKYVAQHAFPSLSICLKICIGIRGLYYGSCWCLIPKFPCS